jgi:hypothetical protein
MSEIIACLQKITNKVTALEDEINEQERIIDLVNKRYQEEKNRTITVKDFTTEVLLKELLKREVGTTIDDGKITSKDITDAKIKKRHLVAPGRTIKNIDPDSIMRYLPTIGLRPIKTTDYLVDMGYLALMKKGYEKAPVVKVPTKISNAIFETRHNNGLYVTSFGKKVFENWVVEDCFPKDCFIKG